MWVCAAAILALLAAAGCGDQASVASVRVRRTDVPVAPTPTPVPTVLHPLTGVGFIGDQPWQRRPVLAIKVENSPTSRPQSGLDLADVVYEELAEGGITRFIAVYQSRDADRVGPVRSARNVDPQVLKPLGALFAYAGGVPPVVAALRSTQGVVDVGYDRVPDAYYRRTDRAAPHNLYTATRPLWDGRRGGPPEPPFSFLAEGQSPMPTGAASKVSLWFSPREETRFVYDAAAGVYRRFHGPAEHVLENGARIGAANVVVQVVSVVAGSVVDVNGQVTPDSRVTGEGEAVLLSGGQVVRGRWIRESLDVPTRYVDASGSPMFLRPGQTFVELLPKTAPYTVG